MKILFVLLFWGLLNMVLGFLLVGGTNGNLSWVNPFAVTLAQGAIPSCVLITCLGLFAGKKGENRD